MEEYWKTKVENDSGRSGDGEEMQRNQNEWRFKKIWWKNQIKVEEIEW